MLKTRDRRPRRKKGELSLTDWAKLVCQSGHAWRIEGVQGEDSRRHDDGVCDAIAETLLILRCPDECRSE